MIWVQAIAAAHGVSAAQVGLRWLVQQHIPVVTSATNVAYIAEDLDVFSFNLTGSEMVALSEV